MHDLMPAPVPAPIRLADYAPPPWLIENVALDVDIRADGTLVTATLACRRNPAAAAGQLFRLDGEGLETLAIRRDGRSLVQEEYVLDAHSLTLSGDLPEQFTLETVVRIQPDANTALSGFYRSRDGYFTQCEAQGFRRITWFPDRPDVMARYTVTLHADKATFPVLLANGNPVAAGDEADGRHYAVWQDPFRKPSYLFAMVAGKLDVLRDTFTTASGRTVQLAIYVEPGKLDQCPHAMAALKKAMRWDETRFGLECDLDHYMIVAVGDFNMGAMENKGLNIFNTKYVLARADLATDTDFENIDRVVAHEYFHNWTGNRVTCRDWFQLSLKEGLTVFRDQEFGADVHDGATARIKEVRTLRAAQFPEDAGPMAHPVRPASYVEINNFYTATVYEKGAEVVRMIQTLIGREGFRAGLEEYLRRHDGQAVTCEDFVAAMAACAPKVAQGTARFDPERFMRWYAEPGTPRVAASGEYDAAGRRYTLHFTQSNAKASAAAPYPIPIRVALYDPAGGELPGTARTLLLEDTRQSFVFENVGVSPIPSLLRDFSAPVILDYDYSDEALTCLMAHDSDPFNRWEAGQRLASRLILAATAAITAGRQPVWPAAYVEAARRLLAGYAGYGAAFVAEALNLPGEATLAESLATVDPEALHAARRGLRMHLATVLSDEFSAIYAALASDAPYQANAEEAGRRALRNLCLGYLAERASEAGRAARQLAFAQYEQADNMTDRFAALSVLAQDAPVAGDEDGVAGRVLADFYERYRDEPLVVDKWLSVQATSRAVTLTRMQELSAHPAFDSRNPNKVYALLLGFGANHRHFHAADGGGYRFIADWIIRLDRLNPQVAARLTRRFDRWRKFDAGRQAHARAALTAIRQTPDLSRDVREVVENLLS